MVSTNPTRHSFGSGPTYHLACKGFRKLLGCLTLTWLSGLLPTKQLTSKAPEFVPPSRSRMSSSSKQSPYPLCAMDDKQIVYRMRNTNTALLQKLASAVDGHAATATFACGGSIPVLERSIGNFGPRAQHLVPPITIRWDPRRSFITQSKIAFPVPNDSISRELFNELLQHCDSATFGFNGCNILDEAYRKATKLDAPNFATNFHPHDCGILDSIQQILLPSTIRGGQGVGIGPQGIRAELYKLNVCTSKRCQYQVSSGMS